MEIRLSLCWPRSGSELLDELQYSQRRRTLTPGAIAVTVLTVGVFGQKEHRVLGLTPAAAPCGEEGAEGPGAGAYSGSHAEREERRGAEPACCWRHVER